MCLTEFNEKVFVEAIREEGREEGREAGLKALVDTLKQLQPDEESIYQKIIENENYKDVLREDVIKYMKQ